MSFAIVFSSEADAQMDTIEANPTLSKRSKAVQKALAFLESNPRHPCLKTHKFSAMIGPGKDVITVLAVTEHP